MLTISVPKDNPMADYLSKFRFTYRLVDENSASVCFSYGGVVPPLSQISLLLAKFEPEQYTISKSMTGFSFIVWPNE